MLSKENIKNVYSLTPMQEGMLFYYLYNKNSNAYFEQLCLTLKGNIDKEILEKAFNQLLVKYDVFRTVFTYGGSVKPRQIVLKERKGAIDYRDITYLSDYERKLYVNKFKEEDKTKGFNLSRDLLIRQTLIKSDEQEYRLVISFHHILIDGWCMRDILTDTFMFYGMFLQNNIAAIEQSSEVQYPYSQYIKWLENQSDELPQKYWESYLDGFDERTSIPEASPNLNKKYLQGIECFNLEKDVQNNLEKIAKDKGITTNVLFQAAWGVLLQKYTDKTDVVFGTVVSGRPAEVKGIEQMVGLFINTIPIRYQFGFDKSFVDSALELHKSLSETKKLEYYPLSKIQSLSPLKADLINHLFVFENFPVGEGLEQNEMLDKIGISILDTEVFEQTNYDLNVIVYPGEQYKITFNYNQFVFSKETIETLSSRYIKVLNAIAENPKISTGNISLITDKEAGVILNNFNNTAVDYPSESSIIDNFKEQVALNPSSIALSDANQFFTYADLDSKSDQIASFLIDKGVTIETRVGLYFDRSTDFIISILGVLKAGGVYVPIGTAYPQDRIHFMAENSDFMLVLTNKENVTDKFPKKVYHLNDLPKEHVGSIHTTVGADKLCYIMYTSGSTGEPKGVMVLHRNVIRLVKNTNFARFDSETKMLLTGAPVFDATTFEIWGTLLNGGHLHIIEDKFLLDANLLKETINDRDINTMWLTSPLFNKLVDQNDTFLTSLETILVGGDKLSPDHINRVRDKYCNLQIVNGYGPTENVTFSTTHQIEKKYNRIPIGKPINNSTAYVLNQSRQLQPVGLVGELYVGGDGVARGYLNAPELTETKFIDNPFGKGKLYNTGDLAKWLPDGTIDFLGRRDFQVKIRGYRIEPGEIEQAILEIDGVRKVMVSPKSVSGTISLCAYYETDSNVLAADIKTVLKTKLPEHMVPGYFVMLDQFPLTINGKIDRSKLPNPQVIQEEYEAPKGDVEEKMAMVWSEVLEVKLIGRQDNFFSLGGDSIKAIPIAARLKKQGVVIDVRDIFQYQTISELADYYDIMNQAEVTTVTEIVDLIVLNANELEQQCYVIAKKLTEQFEKYEISVLGKKKQLYGITGAQKGHLLSDFVTGSIPMPFNLNLKDDVFKIAFKGLIEQQSLLRSVVTDQKGVLFWKEFELNGNIEVPTLDISMYDVGTQNSVMTFLNNEVMTQQFNHKEHLMYAVVWIKKSATDHVLFWRMNHALYDIMSLKIIPNSLISNYSTVLKGEKLLNNVKPYSQYADQINKGPIDISKEDLKNTFNLSAFNEQKKELVEELKIKQDNSNGVSFINYKIPLVGEGGEEKAWDIAVKTFVKVFGDYFNYDDLPFSILSFGRNYQGEQYYNTVGEFIDIIPMTLPTFRDEDKIYSTVKGRMDCLESHNINFMNLWANDKLKKQWGDVIDLYAPAIEGGNMFELVLNFQGEYSEEEIINFEESVKQQVAQGQVMNSLFSVMAEVKYTSTYIHFSLIMKIEDDVDKFKEILDRQVGLILTDQKETVLM
ncbi:MAG: hypothetical protein COA88_02425 [Kordia sp.]|nr:MAG: hypothetical protein COA88_02425 [Kordia sp.]